VARVQQFAVPVMARVQQFAVPVVARVQQFAVPVVARVQQFAMPVVARVLQFENPKLFKSHQIIVSNLKKVRHTVRYFRKTGEHLNGKFNEPEH